jgi:hypothetical protein
MSLAHIFCNVQKYYPFCIFQAPSTTGYIYVYMYCLLFWSIYTQLSLFSVFNGFLCVYMGSTCIRKNFLCYPTAWQYCGLTGDMRNL